MTTGDCEMVALVEARHDRRLGVQEAASLERHLESCATCRELGADLERMAELARGGAEAPRLGELERRRNRLRLLKAAARPHHERRRRIGGWQLAAAVFLCGGVAAAARATSSPRPIPAARASEIARAEPLVVATPGAHVRRGRGFVEVEDGAIAILSRAPIRLRYGETEYLVEGGLVIEGTGARVERVMVTSGALSLTHGEGPASLRAGDTWSARDVIAAEVPEATPAAVRVQPAMALGAARAAAPTAPTAPAGSTAARSPSPAAAPSSEPRASPSFGAAAPVPPRESAFTEGVRLIEQGAYGAARARLEAFRSAHPSDARAEDAAFLEVVALERAGRHDDARAAARRYLTMYPNGFRRAEAEALAR